MYVAVDKHNLLYDCGRPMFKTVLVQCGYD